MNDKSNDYSGKIKTFSKELEKIKDYFPHINSAGYPFIIIFFLISLLLSTFSDFLGWVGFVLTIWCVYFFRDPERVIHDLENVLVSPADGKVINICETESPENLHDKKTQSMKRVSIFLDIFNVHVNRMPVSGKINWLKYIPGTFLNASLDKSSENNERMISKIEISKSLNIFVVQIAGLIARRIKCDLVENQSVQIGERFGIIRFGSRVDLYMPLNFDIKVLNGQTVVGGETIIAEFDQTQSLKKKIKINLRNEKIIDKKFNT